MKQPVFLLYYKTTTAPSHGEPGDSVFCIPDPTQIGHFATREEAEKHAPAIARLYHLPTLNVFEMESGVHRTY